MERTTLIALVTVLLACSCTGVVEIPDSVTPGPSFYTDDWASSGWVHLQSGGKSQAFVAEQNVIFTIDVGIYNGNSSSVAVAYEILSPTDAVIASGQAVSPAVSDGWVTLHVSETGLATTIGESYTIHLEAPVAGMGWRYASDSNSNWVYFHYVNRKE